MALDTLSYAGRIFNERLFNGAFDGMLQGIFGKDAEKTLFGYVSMQVLVAAETL